ncbi:unnamed protein product [Allacma fusca]|uniref:Uncharacterized protein n=1 Tax=Allacma fusca TaxID=39272 RepID=A0A8J2J7C7_9HEXA|nr:unnamed protein product [Allacma fusca]
MESDNVKIKTFIKSPVILEAFPKTLSRPSNGKSFGGSTFEQIQSALSSRSMAVEFVNYMETDLTGYQLSLDYGSVKKSAPTTVSSQTAQVATFEPDK